MKRRKNFKVPQIHFLKVICDPHFICFYPPFLLMVNTIFFQEPYLRSLRPCCLWVFISLLVLLYFLLQEWMKCLKSSNICSYEHKLNMTRKCLSVGCSFFLSFAFFQFRAFSGVSGLEIFSAVCGLLAFFC